MKPLTPEVAVNVREFLVKQIATEHAVTRTLIAAIPPDKLNVQPVLGQRTISDSMWRLVQYEDHALTSICNGQFAPEPRPPEQGGAEAVLAWDAERFPQSIERIEQLSGDDLLRPLEVLGSSIPAIEFIPMYLSAVLQSRAHLAVCLVQSGAFGDAAQAAAASANGVANSSPQLEDDEDTLSDTELAEVSGGQYSVVVKMFQTNQTAQQLGWIAPPQTQAGLGSLMTTSSPQINSIMGILSGIFLGISLGAGPGVSVGAAAGGAAFSGLTAASSAAAISGATSGFHGIAFAFGAMFGALGGAAGGGIAGGANG